MKNEWAPAANERPCLRIREWKPTQHGTLHGLLSILLPSGLILNGFQVHESGGRRWIAYPVRVGRDHEHEVRELLITFSDSISRQRFESTLLHALAPILTAGGAR